MDFKKAKFEIKIFVNVLGSLGLEGEEEGREKKKKIFLFFFQKLKSNFGFF